MHRRALSAVLLALLLSVSGALAQEAGAPSLQTLLEGEGGLKLAGRPLERSQLIALYQTRQFEPIWTAARESALVAALADASAHGLDPASFAVPTTAPQERELLLTDAFLRYAAALAQGRVNAAEIESDWAMPAPAFDAATTLDRAADSDPAAVLAALAPADPAYKRLQLALERYRAIAASGGWPRVPEAGRLKRDDTAPVVAKLRRRLIAEGYLPADATGEAFDGTVEAAVKLFQAQHGIAVDGEVGHDTYVALNVPVAVRLEQIRDNLERWREMPRDWPATHIEVNVPAAWLTVVERGAPVLGMRAIVGAEKHPTPVLRARMNAVLFNPPWNIPTSIARKEILPHLRRDPHYLERNHYVYVGARSAAVLQQLPGPDNALGRIKFELPNVFDVYLHDTPSHPLFSRVIRALSHGCIRLEDPRQLALYVLAGGKTSWGLDEIDQAIALGDTRRVPLARSIPVYLVYWTAFVDEDGAVEFRNDLYGRDLRLALALDGREAEDRAPGAATPTTPAPSAPLRQKVTKTAAD